MQVGDSIVTLDRLWRVEKQIKLGEVNLIARALSSLDVRNRYDEATLAAMYARRELADPNSRRYLLAIANTIEQSDDEALRELIAMGSRSMATIDAAKDIKPELTPMPDDASETEREDSFAQREKDLAKTNELRNKFVQNRVEQAHLQAQTMDRPTLEAEFIRIARHMGKENAFGEAYEDAGLLYSIRQMDGSPYFESLAEARQCQGEARYKLLMEMRWVNDLDPLHLSGASSTAPVPAPGP